MSFAQDMHKLSLEGELQTVHDQQAGAPEEITVITDNTQSDLEESVEKIGDQVDALADNDQLAEKMVDTIESMEGRIALLQQGRANQVNFGAATAQQFALGIAESMEARGFPVSFFKEDLEKLNSSLESNAYDYSNEAEAAATGLKDRALTVLKNTYNAIVEFLRKLVDNFRGLGDNMGKAGDRVQKLAQDAQGKSVPDTKLKGTSYASLHTNSGAFNPTTAMKEAFDAIDKAYDESVDRIAKLTTKLKSGGEVPGAVKIPLTGGYEIVSEDGGKAKLKQVSTKAAAAEVSVATVSVLQAIGKDLSALSVVLHGIEKDNKKVISSLDTLLKTAQADLGKAPAGDQKDATKLNLSEVSKQISVVQSLVPLAVKHASKVAKEAYRYALASGARYSGKDSE